MPGSQPLECLGGLVCERALSMPRKVSPLHPAVLGAVVVSPHPHLQLFSLCIDHGASVFLGVLA